MKTQAEIQEAAAWLAIIKRVAVIGLIAISLGSCKSQATICNYVHSHYSGYK
jgi:hypothetical protein